MCVTDVPFSNEHSAVHYSLYLVQLWGSVITRCHLFKKEAYLMRIERCSYLWFDNKSSGIGVGLILCLLSTGIIVGCLLESMTYLATSSWPVLGARYGLCLVEQILAIRKWLATPTKFTLLLTQWACGVGHYCSSYGSLGTFKWGKLNGYLSPQWCGQFYYFESQ